jgi:hypothetical protein
MNSGLSGVADMGSFIEGIDCKNCKQSCHCIFGYLIEEGRRKLLSIITNSLGFNYNSSKLKNFEKNTTYLPINLLQTCYY